MSETATVASIALYPSAATSATTAQSVSGAVQALTIFGVSLGLRPDILFAGFLGALASIVLLNSVPMAGSGGFSARMNNVIQRLFVALASAATAGYLAPLIESVIPVLSEAWLLGSAFVVGAGARILLQSFIKRYSSAVHADPNPPVNS